MQPYFSIIIPVHNIAPYLCECLDSVLAQTFTDWEAICIDDGSADESGAILDEYAVNDERFRVIHQENKGVGAARNVGLDSARGKWILFLDGDDIWNVKLLAVVTRMIEEYHSEKLFRFGFERFDGVWNKKTLADPQFNCEIIDISHEILMCDFYDFIFWCFAYSKDLFDGIRFPSYIRGEDRCVLNRIMLERTHSFVAMPQPLYGYRKRSGSAVNSTPSSQVLRDEMDHRLDIMEMIDKSGKHVDYAGNTWLERYFITWFYHIINSRGDDRREVEMDWRQRLCRLRRMKGLSHYGRFVVWSCSLFRLRSWDSLVCYAIPRFFNGGSPFRWLKRKVCG